MSKLKKVLLIAGLVSLTGCITPDSAGSDARRFCESGVWYIETPNGVSVLYNNDGSVKRCY